MSVSYDLSKCVDGKVLIDELCEGIFSGIAWRNNGLEADAEALRYAHVYQFHSRRVN